MTPAHRPSREVLLVGSVGLADSEAVFRAVGPLLGSRMRRMPEEYEKMLRSEYERFGALVKRIGLQVE